MPKTRFKGVIFDLDGVITATARVHATAWKAMFDEFLKDLSEREGRPYLPFDPKDDYLNYVDGKPRFEGVLSFLRSRNIQLPAGDPGNDPDELTICGLGNKKNVEFQKILKREGPEVFSGSVEMIKDFKKRGIKMGVASSSKNCQLVLELAGLEALFDTLVDGMVSEELGLKGKPEPDIFTAAAANMGLRANECVVVEDAISGVQAGRAGNFGLVLGIARNIQGELLKQFGADVVIQDLSEVKFDDVQEWFESGLAGDGWFLTYDGFDPGDEKLRETLCTVGNGYMGVRGCFEAERASFSFYPGTYIAGVYNRLPTKVQGRDVYNNDFVNCPNWCLIEFRIGAGEFLSPLSMELLSYYQTLNMREGVMERSIVCKDRLGRITRIHSTRLVSMASPHLCAIKYEITPCNYSAPMTIRSYLDGEIVNEGVARYRQLNSKHLCRVAGGDADGNIFLHVETSASGYQIVMNARHELLEDGRVMEVNLATSQEKKTVCQEMEFYAGENSTYALEKYVAVHTSLDHEAGDLRAAAAETVQEAKTFQGVLGPHVKAWKKLWDKSDCRIDGDRFVQRVARLHTYHLLVTAGPHNRDIDAGMPARGLHGEAYRGHIFWDELYIQPFYDLKFPEVSKALLLYRCKRLEQARKYAEENGYKGAMYPWQTADTGEEETQEVHFNPESKKWDPDLSRRQRHVSIAVFFNIWRYASTVGDTKFLHEHGAEVMLEIARFWASAAKLDRKTGKYHIDGVMGPDEFHEKLPGAKKPGIKDNAYTNVMVVWLMEKSLELLERLPAANLSALKKRIGFKEQETEKWRDMTTKMNVIMAKGGIISQFDGYMDLKELDWDGYRKRYYSIHRMDRILKAENDSPDNYKVAKQADTLMLFYVLEPDEVARILRQLGHEVGDPIKLLADNYAYYEQRTSHGSTLSKVVHAVISGYIRSEEAAWDWFMEAMRSDVFDTQGGTTIEGVHTGVMAGTLEVIIKDFAGVNFFGPVPVVEPDMPDHWNSMSFSLLYRRLWYDFTIDRKRIKVGVRGKNGSTTPMIVCGAKLELPVGDEIVVDLPA